MHHITIKDIYPIEKGTKVEMDKNVDARFMNGQIVVVEKSKPITERIDLNDSEEYDPDLKEFIRTFQLRPGDWFYHEKGLVSNPTKEEIYIETETSKNIEKSFNAFWDNLEIMKKYKKNKRAYLLHSLPGMGKSALIRHFCRKFKGKDGLCILHVDSDIEFKELTYMFKMPYHEDVKSIVLIIEDMGGMNYGMNQSYFNSSCLNFLDGEDGIFRVPVMILVTTNFAKFLGPQFTNRPGRFSKIIRVEPPPDEEMFKLVESIGNINLTEDQKQQLSGKGLSPDHCIEALVRHDIENISLTESVRNILKERDGLVDNDFFNKPQ